MTPGQKLIAKDPCNMNDDGRAVLTVGKEYPIVDIAHEFVVINDEGYRHAFDDDELVEFFEAPSPSFGTWYPIESAPKDGTEVLVLNNVGKASVAKWVDSESVYDDRSAAGNMKYWQGVCCGWGAWSGHQELNFECQKITHWTPLPELPKE